MTEEVRSKDSAELGPSDNITQQSDVILENADIEFEVEDLPVKANKGCLSMVSPVFSAMFKDDSKEKRHSTIPLPEKNYDDVVEFIEVTHVGKPVDKTNIEVLLPLAHEYCCKLLLDKCESILLKMGASFYHLSLAIKYGLEKAEETCFTGLLDFSFYDFRIRREYDNLDLELKIQYLERKVRSLEGDQTSLSIVNKKLEKLENIQKISSMNAVCSPATLDRVKTHGTVEWHDIGNYNTLEYNASEDKIGDHVAGSKIPDCERCCALRYLLMEPLIKNTFSW